MAALSDQAICLRRIDYSENSQVLVVLTRRHGKQRLIAKGIKRAKKGQVAVGVDLLELGQVGYLPRPQSADALGVLTEWKQSDNFAGLRLCLLSLYAGQYAVEVTTMLTEDDDPHPALFDALAELLAALANAQPPVQSLVRFQAVLLKQVGFMPRLDSCVSCSRRPPWPEPVYLTAHEGGLLCPDCEPAHIEKYRLNWPTVWAVGSPRQTGRAAAVASFEMLDYYITETVGRQPKVSSFLRQVAGGRR